MIEINQKRSFYEKLYKKPKFMAFFGFIAIIAITTLVLTACNNPKRRRFHQRVTLEFDKICRLRGMDKGKKV